MKILLDTHVIIWLLESPEHLDDKTLEILANKKTKVYYSIASIWELAIKLSIGKIKVDLGLLLETLKQNSIEPLTIEENHIMHIEKLPQYHKDPFDRMIIAQAIYENIVLFTRDEIFTKYLKKILN
ncbi:MAG: type II toxin-antitoxin system VapC family toxin [Neisseriaceae bacterium]|jgi:PIN domain nuclease of toxin-antitoxin system